MKKSYFFLLLSAFFIVSCSNDDNGSNDTSTAEFLPLTTGNYWIYNVTGDAQSGRDSLYISNDTIISGNTYKKFKTRDLPAGFYSGSLDNNGVRKSGDRLLASGTSQFAFSEDFPLDVQIADFVIFKENASPNETLGSVTDSFEQPFDGYTVAFNYTLSSKAVQSLDTYTVDGTTYTNVKEVKTILNLAVIANVDFNGVTIPATIMPAQDVLVSTQYYVANIGVVHVVTDINYNLSDISQFGIELPIPQSASSHQEEILADYGIQ